MTNDDDRPTPQAPEDPWEKFGWVMGAIWLVFLGFPIAASVTAPHDLVWRVLGVCLILAFAGVYIHGFIRISNAETWGQVTTFGWQYLAALTGLVLATSAVIGLEALAMVTFIVAFGMFSLPLRTALTLAVASLVVPAVLLVGFREFGEYWFFLPIIGLVATATGLVRVLEQRQSEHQEVESELALVAERDRVARDVHDVLGHSLTVVTVKAELARRLVDVDPERAKAELDQIQSLTREALAEIRATIAGLRVARLADELESARSALGDAGITANLPSDPEVVDPRHRIVVAWVLREAITNVVRHSGAGQVTVTLGEDRLVVEDDGKGLGSRREGNGIRGVRERVEGAGGQLTVAGGDPRGTRLEVQL